MRALLTGISEESPKVNNLSQDLASSCNEFGKLTEDVAKSIQIVSENATQQAEQVSSAVEKTDETIKEMKVTSSIAGDIAASTENVTAITEEHTVIMEEISETANELLSFCDRLSELVSKFNISK